MIQFEWIWAFAVLPLPYLLRRLLPESRNQQIAALRVPFIEDFKTAATHVASARPRRWPMLLAILSWFFLIVATARPQLISDPIELPTSGRDLMLAVDLSGSMETRDFQINGTTVDRLQATQVIASEFIQRRVGDRIGLILFGEQAYLQTPLTFDRETVRTLLGEAVIGLAGKATAIGDAIGLMVKRLSEQDTTNQVMILLTDGANTAGEVEPVKAAELAAKKDLKIYTIGIGADEMQVRTLFGSRSVNPSADLDEETLTAIAEKTGGQYFRARDIGELQKIYKIIDQLEPIEQEAKVFRPIHALYIYPLGIAVTLATMLALTLSFSGLRQQYG